MKYLTSNNQDIQAQSAQILAQLRTQELLVVNPRSRNGLIIYKRYHAEFAGPGAVVANLFDFDAEKVLPVGNLSFVYPQSSEERQRAYRLRRQWIQLIRQITDNPSPLQRAQMILNQFEHYFDVETLMEIPDEAFGLLVGVLPQTISKVRHSVDRGEV